MPAAFSPDGAIGVFESNSILRAVARAGSQDQGLYGRNGMDASRIDSFLDATLVFGREAQVYLLGVNDISTELHQRMRGAFEFFLEGVERALGNTEYLAGDELTIADIAFVCDFSQFMRERLMRDGLDAASLPLVSEGAETDHLQDEGFCAPATVGATGGIRPVPRAVHRAFLRLKHRQTCRFPNAG